MLPTKPRAFTLALQAHALRHNHAYHSRFRFLLAYIVGRGWLNEFIDYVFSLN